MQEAERVLDEEAVANNRRKIKSLYKSFKDLQQLRIQTGARIVANVKYKLGIEPGDGEQLHPEAKNIINKMVADFNKITTGMVVNSKLIQGVGIISDHAEYALAKAYMQTYETELELQKEMKRVLSDLPEYRLFLKHVTGIGPSTAAAIISMIDVFKVRHVSQIYRYCGLDVVAVEEGVDEFGAVKFKFEGRGKKKAHLVDKTYANSKGEVKHTKGISYNPDIKSVLLGIVASQFIKLKNPLSKVYYGYKTRLENHREHKNKTASHRHAMAMRYMIKIFLYYYYCSIRENYGLRVDPMYSIDKLGYDPHKDFCPFDLVKSLNRKEDEELQHLAAGNTIANALYEQFKRG